MGPDYDLEGQTPLDEDEKEGLLVETISTRGELDEFEQENIQQAMGMGWNKEKKQQKYWGGQISNIHRSQTID